MDDDLFKGLKGTSKTKPKNPPKKAQKEDEEEDDDGRRGSIDGRDIDTRQIHEIT